MLFSLGASWATQWHNPLAEMKNAKAEYIHGRGWVIDNFSRFPADAEGRIPAHVWGHSRNSAGLYLVFETDSPDIMVRYGVTGAHAMPHMAATGVSGVDLYQTTDPQDKKRCWGGFWFGQDTIVYHYRDVVHSTQKPDTYTLYLPLYNSTSWMEIGVPDNARFRFIAKEAELPIMIYGTSIVHGACASRPGMAWSNILQRTMDRPVVNLGFSGSGRLEPEVVEYVAAVPAAIYVVDCMPNMSEGEEKAYNLVYNAVKQIRKANPDTPILLVDHPGYGSRFTNAWLKSTDETYNKAQLRAFNQLTQEGVQKLYHLDFDTLGMPIDGMADDIHPNDLGMQVQADAVRAQIQKILN